MQTHKGLIGMAVLTVFLMGAGSIVYMGRPVMKIVPITDVPLEQPIPSTFISGPAPSPTPTPVSPQGGQSGSTSGNGATMYTMADVRAHATQSNCWSAVGGNVYDLTTWVSRHPGGEAVIVAMCGVDGTSAYNGQHGSSRRPLSMLALLKIGTLQ